MLLLYYKFSYNTGLFKDHLIVHGICLMWFDAFLVPYTVFKVLVTVWFANTLPAKHFKTYFYPLSFAANEVVVLLVYFIWQIKYSPG